MGAPASALGQLFAFLVGAEIVYPNNEPAMRAYGSVISFQGRASMLEEAAAGYFHTRPNEEFQSRFRKILSTECRQFSGRRNDIAHGRWQQAWQKNGQLGHFLMPGYQSSKHWKLATILRQNISTRPRRSRTFAPDSRIYTTRSLDS
jgi:hypothetical protein